MEYFEIVGGEKLFGEVSVFGAKNSILPILCASILCRDEVVLSNVVLYKDVENILKILKKLNVEFSYYECKKELKLNSKNLKNVRLESD